MLLKIVYLLVRRILGLAVLISRGDRAKDAELLVLRHENAALKAQLSDKHRFENVTTNGPPGRSTRATSANTSIGRTR